MPDSDDKPKKSLIPFTFVKGFLIGVAFQLIFNKFALIGGGESPEHNIISSKLLNLNSSNKYCIRVSLLCIHITDGVYMSPQPPSFVKPGEPLPGHWSNLCFTVGGFVAGISCEQDKPGYWADIGEQTREKYASVKREWYDCYRWTLLVNYRFLSSFLCLHRRCWRHMWTLLYQWCHWPLTRKQLSAKTSKDEETFTWDFRNQILIPNSSNRHDRGDAGDRDCLCGWHGSQCEMLCCEAWCQLYCWGKLLETDLTDSDRQRFRQTGGQRFRQTGGQ